MSAPRPFRFGIMADWPDMSHTAWIDHVKRAEDLGYATLHVDDHIHRQFGPFTALATAAAVTNSIRLGAYVLSQRLSDILTLGPSRQRRQTRRSSG